MVCVWCVWCGVVGLGFVGVVGGGGGGGNGKERKKGDGNEKEGGGRRGESVVRFCLKKEPRKIWLFASPVHFLSCPVLSCPDRPIFS